MQGMFLIFNFLEHFLCYHAGSLNDQGQMYFMPDCMTRLDTVTLNNASEHTQAYSRTEQMTLNNKHTKCHMLEHQIELSN